ncbi:MAG TPA: hypothetical protein VEH62_11145 [Gemmatimonadales bacterium]|nr:hypothetical protein [Gemmatimonadales bacterium]
MRALIWTLLLAPLAACASAGGPAAGLENGAAPAVDDTVFGRTPRRNELVRVVFPATDSLRRRYLEGRFLGLAGDSLTVGLPHAVETIVLADGRALQVTQAHDRRTAGLTVGTMVGVLAGGLVGSHCTSGFFGRPNLCSLAVAGAVLAGGFAGGAIGWQIGKLVHTDTWVTVGSGSAGGEQLSLALGIRVGVGPARGGSR